MSKGELFSRDEVMGGLSARRSRALLFLIDQHSARLAETREVGATSMLGERTAEARELASIEHFAMGREPTRRPSIRQIEMAADGWGPLVPRSASIRAGVAALLGERYRLDPERLPRTVAALGLEEPRVAEAYERQTGASIDDLWTSLGPLERLRWAASAPGRWLERTTPFRAAAALTFLLSMGQTVVVVPIAVATVGPLAAAVSIVVIGLLAITATAAVAEAATRSAEVRFRGGFFGRLVIGGLGPLAGGVPTILGIVAVVLPTVSALVGLGLLLAFLLPLPAVFWAVLAGAISTALPLRGSRSVGSFGGLLSFGLSSLVLLGLLSVIVLVIALLEGGLETPALGPPEGIGIELALGVIIGVLLGSYADPIYAVQIGRIVLPRDPDGRGLVRGSMVGMALFILVTTVFSAVVLLTLPAGEVAAEAGSVLDPLSSEYGVVVGVLAGLIGVGLFGIRLYGNAIALYDFVAEMLPGRPPTKVVLGARRGRILLSARDGGSIPAAVLAYRGRRSGSPVLAVSRPSADGFATTTTETRLSEDGTVVDEEVGIRVLSVEEDRLRLELDTPMAISYDDADGLLGKSVAETLLAEDGSGALAAWLLRVGGASPAAAAEYLEVPESEAREQLEGLVAAGSAREGADGRFEAQVAARRKRGTGLGSDLWDRIGVGAEADDSGAEDESRSHAAVNPLVVSLACSAPMVALTVISALLLAAGTGSVSGPLKIAGVICFATVSGVLPPLMLLAARRRPDIAGASTGGLFVAKPLLAASVVLALVALVLHATILWADPVENALAALATLTALTTIWFSIRHGSFRPATVVDLREEPGQPGIRVLAERAGSEQSTRLALGDTALPPGARADLLAEGSLSVEAPVASGGELRVSAQNIDVVGGSAAIPLEVELRGAGSGEIRRLDESGGATIFELGEEPADWTLVFRRPAESGAEDGGGAPAVAPDPLPAADEPEPPAPGGRRKRGGGGSPLDKL